MGLGRRHYRMLGANGPFNFGPINAMQLQLNGGYLGEYGGSQANMWVYRGALRIPAVWRATLLLSGLLAQSPWDAYTTHGQDTAMKLDPRPPLLEQLAPPDARVTSLRSGMIDRVHDGNALFIIAARDAKGTPTAVWPVPAAWVGVRRINNENQETSYLPIGAVEYKVGGQSFTADDVIHVKGPCAPGALRGAGVLEMFLTGTFETAHEQEREALKMARHGVPAGILKFLNDNIPAKPSVTDGSAPVTMADRMRNAADQWLAARDHSGVAVMNSAVDFTPLSWDPDKMQMIQARQFTLLQVANIMGVPPKFVGATVSGNSETYATSETGGKELLRDTMGIYFEEFEQAFGLAFPRGTTVRFNRDSFTRADQLQRFQAYQIGIESNFLKPSEARAEEYWAPVPGIDDLPPTAALQKQINKTLPITQEGIKQVLGGDLGGQMTIPKAALTAPDVGPTPPTASGPTPVAVTATRLPANRAVSQLEFGQGHALFAYWAHGKGFAEWAMSPNPWTTLHDLLASKGVPVGQIQGLATNIMLATPAGKALFAAHHNGGH